MTGEPCASDERLRMLRRRLKAAKRRLLYWSGRPSFTGFGFSPHNQGNADIQYEAAMADVEGLADEIEELTGKRPVVRDVKEEYREVASRMFGPIPSDPRPSAPGGVPAASSGPG